MIRTKTNVKYLKLAGIAGLIIIIDQITKAVILDGLPLHHSVSVISNFFSLTHIQNPGGAFGFLADHSSNLRSILFLFASLLAIGLLFYLYTHTPKTQPLLATGFSLMLGGALGNLIDRVRFGKVIDFLDFYIGNLHWPAFNVADSAITVGIAIFLFHLLLKKRPDPDEQETKKD